MNNDQTPKLNAALASAQGEMPHVEFDATNPFLKNKFASLGAVISTSKPILAKHGLSIEQMPVSDAGSIGVRTTLRHSSGESTSGTISLPLAEERGKSQAQVAGSIITYLRRYSWASVLGMYADEDNDGHAVEPKPVAASPAPQPATGIAALKKELWAITENHPKVNHKGDPKKLQQFLWDEAIVMDTEILGELSESRLSEVVTKTKLNLNLNLT